jgi:hypothetical protein
MVYQCAVYVCSASSQQTFPWSYYICREVMLFWTCNYRLYFMVFDELIRLWYIVFRSCVNCLNVWWQITCDGVWCTNSALVYCISVEFVGFVINQEKNRKRWLEVEKSAESLKRNVDNLEQENVALQTKTC